MTGPSGDGCYGNLGMYLLTVTWRSSPSLPQRLKKQHWMWLKAAWYPLRSWPYLVISRQSRLVQLESPLSWVIDVSLFVKEGINTLYYCVRWLIRLCETPRGSTRSCDKGGCDKKMSYTLNESPLNEADISFITPFTKPKCATHKMSAYRFCMYFSPEAMNICISLPCLFPLLGTVPRHWTVDIYKSTHSQHWLTLQRVFSHGSQQPMKGFNEWWRMQAVDKNECRLRVLMGFSRYNNMDQCWASTQINNKYSTLLYLIILYRSIFWHSLCRHFVLGLSHIHTFNFRIQWIWCLIFSYSVIFLLPSPNGTLMVILQVLCPNPSTWV